MQTTLSNEKLDPAAYVPSVGLHNVASVHVEANEFGPGVSVTKLVIRDAQGREMIALDLFAAKALLGAGAGKPLAIEFVEHQPASEKAA